MLVIEFVFALVVSIVCAAVLLPLAAQGGWRLGGTSLDPLGVFVLLLILFLATWAGGIWLVPIGPRLWGVAWTSFVAVGFFVALLIGALVGPKGEESATGWSRIGPRVINLLSLLVMVLLILAIVAGYADLRWPALQSHVGSHPEGFR
jgi:hypothetical protein